MELHLPFIHRSSSSNPVQDTADSFSPPAEDKSDNDSAPKPPVNPFALQEICLTNAQARRTVFSGLVTGRRSFG